MCLSACQSATAPTPTATREDVIVPTAATTIPTNTIPPSSTGTLSPTIEVVQETPSPLPTLTQTSLPSPTPDLQATLVSTVTPVTFSSYTSPDGELVAEVVTYDCTAIQADDMEYSYEEIRLVNHSNGETTIIEGQFSFCGGLGSYGLEGVSWSSDSRYFYYTPDREGGPDGCGYFVPRLSRYDVMTGEILALGLATAAPDGNTYASWAWDMDQKEQLLRVWQIDSEEIREFSPYQPTEANGPIAWSPDGSEFIYLQRTYQCTEEGTAWLVRVNAETLEQEVVLETEEYHLWTVQWTETETLTLGTIGFENSKSYTYDLATGVIEEVE